MLDFIAGALGKVSIFMQSDLLENAVLSLGRLRARSIAGLFPQPPSEPDMKLIASSGSPVPLSR